MIKQQHLYLIVNSLDSINETLKIVAKAGYKAISVTRTVEKYMPQCSVIIEGPARFCENVQRVVRWANHPGLLEREALLPAYQTEFDNDLKYMDSLVFPIC